MTIEEIKSITTSYNQKLLEMGFTSKRMSQDKVGYLNAFPHIMWMCEKVQTLTNDYKDLQKANRWLGFIQGILWVRGVFHVDNLKNHNVEGFVPEKDVKWD